MATQSSFLTRRIPLTKEPGGYSPWGCKESESTESLTLSLFFHISMQCLQDGHWLLSLQSQERQNWYSPAQGLKHTKQSHQVTYSKGSEIISQEIVKGQSWTLANQGPRPYFECAGFEKTIPAKPLLHTQVFPFWSSFHLLSGLCCTSMCCFSSDLLDLGFAFRSPHQNHWIITLEVQCITSYSEILP